MKTILKIFGGLLGVLVAVLMLGAIYINWSWSTKKFEAPYPEIKASKDSTIIARGKYLAFGPAHCANCHVPFDKMREVENGLDMPLIGGWELEIPIGNFRARNLTPDMETGIGKLTDAELARTLRHSVGSDGRFILELMPCQNMSDEDLTAIISFLRSQEPVKNEIKPSEFTFLGKAIFTLMDVQPTGPKAVPPISMAMDTSIEHGRYLAYSVTNCYGCHTVRDLKTGEFTGSPFAGGMYFDADRFTEGYSYVTPNLTPDEETGVMAKWNEQAFVSRFKAGRVHRGSHMPWGAFSRMNEADLRAIFRFLRSVEPIKNSVSQTVFAPGERPNES